MRPNRWVEPLKSRCASSLILFLGTALVLAGCGQDQTRQLNAPSMVVADKSPEMPVAAPTNNVPLPEAIQTQAAQATIIAAAPTVIAETATAHALLPTATAASIPTLEEVLERDYGTWSYIAGRSSSAGMGASIRYDISSVAALNAYALANRALAAELVTRGGEVEVYITFRTYLAPAQFRAWVAANGATVKRSMLRTIYPDGQLGTVGQGTHPGDTEPLPQHRLDQALNPTPRGTRPTLRGLYWTLITVQATQLPGIVADPLVFLADVTPNVVREDLAAAGWEGVAQAIIDVNPNSPFYMMEELGLENFVR